MLLPQLVNMDRTHITEEQGFETLFRVCDIHVGQDGHRGRDRGRTETTRAYKDVTIETCIVALKITIYLSLFCQL